MAWLALEDGQPRGTNKQTPTLAKRGRNENILKWWINPDTYTSGIDRTIRKIFLTIFVKKEEEQQNNANFSYIEFVQWLWNETPMNYERNSFLPHSNPEFSSVHLHFPLVPCHVFWFLLLFCFRFPSSCLLGKMLKLLVTNLQKDLTNSLAIYSLTNDH